MAASDLGTETGEIPPRCPRCGRRGPVGARFCPWCGAALPARRWSDQEGSAERTGSEANERKLVTVLFADVVNSTGLAEALDPEEYHGALTALFRQLAAALRDHGAYVEKYVGDAVMAVFGAPTTGEDDAARALRASKALHAIVDQAADAWAARLGRRLDLRIGINSGLVIAGRVGEGRAMDYGVLGEVVNLAARLQSVATPGQTVVGEATRSLVGDAFAFELLPPLRVQGKSRPVHAFLLRGERAETDAWPIGREVEREALREAVAAVAAGERVAVAIVGAPGTGKTLLLETARRESVGQGVAWVRLAVWPHLQNEPFALVGALIRERAPTVFRPSRRSDRGRMVSPVDTCRALAARAGLAGDPSGAAVVDAIAGFGAGLAAHLDDLPASKRRQIVFDGAARLVDALLSAPSLLLLDDAHRLDEASAAVLRSVLERRGPRGRLGYVAALRPGAPFPVVPDVELTLGPLDRATGMELVAAIISERGGVPPRVAVDPTVAEDLWSAANGNPRRLVELARARASTAATSGGSVNATSLPPSLQVHLLAELDRLPDEARRIARVAAVAGPEFAPEALRAMLADDDLDLATGLAALVEANVLASVAGGYRFRVPLLAEVARTSLLLAEQRQLHQRLATWIATHCPDDLEAIARHYQAADDARAAGALHRLGDRRRSEGNFVGAVEGYREALDLLDRTARLDLAIRLALADALASLGRIGEALAALDRARAVAGTSPLRVEILTRAARLWMILEDLDEARTALREAGENPPASASLSPAPTGIERDPGVLVEVVRAELFVQDGHPDEALTRADALLAQLHQWRQSDDDVTSGIAADVAALRRRLGYVLVRAHLARDDTAAAWSALAADPIDDDPEFWFLRSLVQVQAGEDQAAIASLNALDQAARARGDASWSAVAGEIQARLALRRGEIARARDLAAAAAASYAELGNAPGAERCHSLVVVLPRVLR